MAKRRPRASLVDVLAILFSEDFGLRPRHRWRRDLTRAQVVRLVQLSSPRCGRHRRLRQESPNGARESPQRPEPKERWSRRNRPEFLDRKGRTRRNLHVSPTRSLRWGRLSPGRSGGGRRLTRGLRLGLRIVSRGQDHRIHRIGIATAPSRRCRPPSLTCGIARVPPCWDLIDVTSARARVRHRANRQTRSAFGTLCVFAGVPILRLERPPAGADYSYHGSLSWEQSAPLVHTVMGARLRSNVVL